MGYSTVEAILANRLAPSLADWYLARTGFSGQQVSDMPVSAGRPDNLFEPVPELAATHGMFDDQAKVRSLQLWSATHRAAVVGAVAGTVAAGAAVARPARSEVRASDAQRP